MLQSKLGREKRIDISISKYEREIDKLPKLSSLKGNSSLKRVANDYGYELKIVMPQIYLIRK